MRSWFYLLVCTTTAFSLLSACHKSSTQNCDAYWIAKARKAWMPMSSCSPEFNHYLGKGMYSGTVLYYTSISCTACSMAPPAYGFTCKGDTVHVADWKAVTDIKILATCRDL
ncbi:hypothetical protein LQ567_13225 [Niabella pedocola]|uniref:Uncharacterized protein n=1 Tax=Niabella pedocola TaxID=1752077 RepID=A0ABS8PRL5_9BACT|nr:hypothetical protein [Niabella pedocola]MCD2423731.1 hypothetical protein [Niabella pedocola]